ncbi:MAG: Arginine N-methyltransferase 2 [Caeruleum heppii]|nr:MAG: Arginine N-methyltransferase 2 [Caeruleum heppii]
MDPPIISSTTTSTSIDPQTILLAAAHHDLPSLRALLRTGPANLLANVQDPETGFTPLHAAIAACYSSSGTASPASVSLHERPASDDVGNEPVKSTNGDHIADAERSSLSEREKDIEAATQTVRLLLEHGAIWNDLDNEDLTPGCLALRLGREGRVVYEVMVEAGVRAEMLLGRLDEGWEVLGEGEEHDEEEGDEDGVNGDDTPGLTTEIPPPSTETPLEAPSATVPPPSAPSQNPDDTSLTNPSYLHSTLALHPDRLLDASHNAVMMSWETTLMRRTATLLAPTQGLRILNVGHGMGIIDNFFQDTLPLSHHIVEAHSDVLKKMRQDGWCEKKDVTVHEGRWQDVLPQLVAKGDVLFDVIYFDTFAEDYKDLREFFGEVVVGLLDGDGHGHVEGEADGEGEGKKGGRGRWGFFHGLGADRRICYDVYTKVVEMDLFEAGFDTEWHEVDVPDLSGGKGDGDGEWSGVRRPYWTLDTYRLPICRFVG